MADRDEVVVTSDPLPLGHLASRVVCPTAGAIATFIGTTRDHFEGLRVLRLEVRLACQRWQLVFPTLGSLTGAVSFGL